MAAVSLPLRAGSGYRRFLGDNFPGGGAAPPDLSGWRVSEVDERVRLVREVAGEGRYTQIELNALVQQVIVTRIAEARRRS